MEWNGMEWKSINVWWQIRLSVIRSYISTSSEWMDVARLIYLFLYIMPRTAVLVVAIYTCITYVHRVAQHVTFAIEWINQSISYFFSFFYYTFCCYFFLTASDLAGTTYEMNCLAKGVEDNDDWLQLYTIDSYCWDERACWSIWIIKTFRPKHPSSLHCQTRPVSSTKHWRAFRSGTLTFRKSNSIQRLRRRRY